MTRIRSAFILIIALFSFCTTSYAKGYRVSLATDKGDSLSYVLGIWRWGVNVPMDTVQVKKGKVQFAGKDNLECGNYTIHDINGKKLLEFIVPAGNGKFRISFAPEGKGYKVIEGNGENVLFSEFQNLVNYGWEEMSSAREFADRINGMREKAALEFPGSLTDIILDNTLFTPESAQEIREKFPFGDTVILNTPFAEDKVEQYLELLQYNHNDTIAKYVDSMIASAGNRKLMEKLAHTAYNFFYNSNIMGQEGIAVGIARDWYLSGKIEWPNEMGKFMLRTFVEFNKNSLIGMDAPELELTDTLGNKISLRSLDAEYTIVYFYTNDCATCKKETPQLVDFVNGYNNGVLAVYAVYANSNIGEWKEYINREMYIFNPFMNWVNVYDPDFSSGFHMLYNVVSTPQMFLLDSEKKIIGRGLDVKALKELLAEKNRQRDELREFIADYFTPIKDDAQQIAAGIDLLYNRTKTDNGMFKEFFREAFSTLYANDNYTLQEGAVYLAEKYILGMKEKWDSRFVELVENKVKAFQMNRLGEPAANIQLELPDNSPVDLFDATTEYKVLYFYRPNCGMCLEVTPKMAEIYNEFKDRIDIGFYAINLGSNYKEWIEYLSGIGAEWTNARGVGGDAYGIYEKYHLEEVPAIYLLKDNIVVAKDINDIDLRETLKTIIQ